MSQDRKGAIGPVPVEDPKNALDDLYDAAVQDDLGRAEVGTNRGLFVDMLNDAAGVARGSPWCATFVMYRVRRTASKWNTKNRLFLSPSVMTILQLNKNKVHQFPNKGDLCLMQWGVSGDGHMGIVGEVHADGSHQSVEGNTSDDDPNTRNGGMVAVHMRRPYGTYGKLAVRGYLTPFDV